MKQQNTKNEGQAYTEIIPQEFIDRATVRGQCDADCKAPVHRQGQVWCLQTGSCKNQKGCSCVLFKLSKDWDDFEEDPPWERLDGRKHPYEPKKYFYRCWCVR